MNKFNVRILLDIMSTHEASAQNKIRANELLEKELSTEAPQLQQVTDRISNLHSRVTLGEITTAQEFITELTKEY